MSFLPSFDRRLVGRVRKYMSEHRRVTTDQMADDLQATYRNDYSRRKRNAFRKLVSQVHRCIIEENKKASLDEIENNHLSKRRKEDSGNSSSSDSSENEELLDYKETNSINSSLTMLYKKQKKSESQSLPSSPYRYNVDDGLVLPDQQNASNKKRCTKASKNLSTAFSKRLDKRTDINGNIRAGNKTVPECDALQQNVDSNKSQHSKVSQNSVPASQYSSAGNETDFQNEEMEMDKTDFFFIDTVPEKPSDNKKTEKSSATPKITPNGSETPETHADQRKHSTRAKTPKNKKRRTNSKDESDIDIKGSEKKPTFTLQASTVKFEDIGGNEKTLKEVCKLLVHMRHPEIYTTLGVTPPCGVLLHGPPGCGKSLLASAIAGELALPMLKLAATEIVSGVSGESEQKLREVFEMALSSAPCIIFIDEIDAITPKREVASKDMERRIVAQLLSCLDDLISSPSQVLVIGATNRPDSIDPALRRAGRFDREICMGIPDEKAREDILRVLCKKLKLEADFSFSLLARLTPGYVGADLMSLCREAAMCAVNRILSGMRETTDNLSGTNRCGKAFSITYKETLNSGVHLATGDATEIQSKEDKLADDNLASNVPANSEGVPVIQNATEAAHSAIGHERNAAVRTDMAASEQCVDHRMDISKDSFPTENVADTSDVKSPQNQCNYSLGGAVLDSTPNVADSAAVTANSSPKITSCRDLTLPELLAWLREASPLTEQELNDLRIDVGDFENALPLVQPSAKREGFATVPDTTWDDIGALEDIREELSVAILAPVKNPAAFKALGLTKPPGILLAGPPGCGKTLLAKAIANESGINFISVKGPELLNMYVGESERAVRQCFERARSSSPCVIFFDELDSLCPKRSGAESNSTARVVNQMLTEMDGLEARKQVYVMAATNRPDIIDPAVLRPGRLDKTLYIGLPTSDDREKILRTITRNGTKPTFSAELSIKNIADDKRCNRFTGADLSSLVREAAVNALRDHISSDHVLGPESDNIADNLRIEVKRDHFEKAFSKVRPSVSVKEEEKYRKMKSALQ